MRRPIFVRGAITGPYKLGMPARGPIRRRSRFWRVFSFIVRWSLVLGAIAAAAHYIAWAYLLS